MKPKYCVECGEKPTYAPGRSYFCEDCYKGLLKENLDSRDQDE